LTARVDAGWQPSNSLDDPIKVSSRVEAMIELQPRRGEALCGALGHGSPLKVFLIG
jgi:hypothetical protein